jgi:hypothetical protein
MIMPAVMSTMDVASIYLYIHVFTYIMTGGSMYLIMMSTSRKPWMIMPAEMSTMVFIIGRWREAGGKLEGTWREHEGNMKGAFREPSWQYGLVPVGSLG